MNDDSCKVPREDLDDGFNPCRKQVVENGELCQYAHMYDVMNERYDREEDTSYLNSVKRDKITSTTPVLLAGNNTQIYANSTNGEGLVNMLSSSAFNNPSNHTEASIPSAKAVADYVIANIPDISALEAEIEGKVDKVSSTFVVDRLYGVSPNGTQIMKNISSESRNIVSGHKDLQTAGSIADYAPIPLPVSKGGTGGNTPYVTDDLDNSAVFVMHDAPNDRYDAAPMSALTGYLDTRYLPVNSIPIPPNSDLNEYKTPGKYAVESNSVVPSIINTPINLTKAFDIYVFPALTENYYIGQQLTTYDGSGTYYRFYSSSIEQWYPWTLLYPTPSSTIPNPLPVSMGGTGAQTAAEALTTLGVPQEISNAFAAHTATTVAENDLLPTNALMIDYVDAHSPATPPSNFSFKVSPFPAGDWEGEMTVNVVPVFSVNIGAVTYVIARVYGSKKFNYTGTADNINLFSSLKPVGDYTGVFSGSTDIPLTLSVSGRSYTAGTYGLTPNVSGSNLSLNNQIVSSAFNLGNFNISTNLKCVFGEGANTPGVTVSVNRMALMWHSLS